MTAISKNVYFDVLDDTVNNRINNKVDRTIKMKPIDVKDNTYILIQRKKPIIKIFLHNDKCQIGLKKFLLFIKLKIQFHGHMLLMILW